MKSLQKLLAAQKGASAVEFAIVAPIFLLTLVGVIEFGRFMWVRQAISQVAYSAARCASMDSNCKTVAAIDSFAVSEASKSNINVTAAQVTSTLATTCNGYTANMVNISLPNNSALVRLIPSVPVSISVQSCFPTRAPNT